jgi:TatD DNase family protein
VIDAHCHLEVGHRGLELLSPIDAITVAEATNVTRIVQVGCDLAAARWSVAVAEQLPGIVAAIGIHPNDAARLVEREGAPALADALAEIERLAGRPYVRGIGETGLDYFRTGAPGRPVQDETFRWHIDLARRTGKALVIHDRDAHADILAILADERANGGLPEVVQFHCFSGDAEMAALCARNGWYVSFAGVVTFRNAVALQEAAKVVPDELILVETDAPYLTPEPYRGQTNASYLVPLTVRRLAELRGQDLEQLCGHLYANAQRAFGGW